MGIPLYPAYKVTTLEDEESVLNTVSVRIETKVPAEMWESFRKRLGILHELVEYEGFPAVARGR